MVRLYYPQKSILGEQIVISEREQVHYLCDVLRLKMDDDVFLFDGQGNECYCQIQGVSKKAVTLLIKEKIKIKCSSKTKLAVACAIPKGKNKFDDLVDKLSQLGVDRIIPMITDRVIVRWDSNQRQRHYQRWCKIAKQACVQSGRDTLPNIEPVKGMNQILSHTESYGLRLIPTLIDRNYMPILNPGEVGCRNFREEGVQDLKGIVSKSRAKSILILIGPEGDFTQQELGQAKDRGFLPVSLGNLVLRVDTAAIAVVAFIRLNEDYKILYSRLQD